MSRSPREMAEAQARQRFIVITAMRFAGVGLVMLGYAIVKGVIDLPYWVGVALAVMGFVDVFAMPVFLARRWKAADAARERGRR
ncbi:hypothetical protein [Porphyrobacter sp. YT40]|uniref:hypothetical protein n=1 Tax=Porphyrobacter sp. YT40 TaxID=2547601 RepID=UPI0011444CAD|nr:hypothetical protein [Porphyrobacter sp. YT40]QDH34105.1 hypothetical protein E2E27_07040 [Porphyrobacter sp. YT40]